LTAWPAPPAQTGAKAEKSLMKSLIHDYAGGVPRSINNIATACLIHAASQNITASNESIVNDTMAEFKLP